VPHQVELLAGELCARGHRPSVLALATGDERGSGETWSEEGWPFPVRRLRADYGRETSLGDGVANPAAEIELDRWVREVRPDLVHVHHLTGFGLGCLSLLHRLGVPSVLTLHDYWCLCPRGQMWHVDGHACATVDEETCADCLARTWPHLMPSGGGEQRGPRGEPTATDRAAVAARLDFAHAQLALPAALITPSRRASEVFAACGLDGKRLEVIPGGVARSSSSAPTAPGATDMAGRAPRLGVLGSTQTSKGALFLAEVIAASPELEVELHIHGPRSDDHGDRRGLERLEAIATTDRRVHLRGPYTAAELPGVLASLEAVAAPALWEETFGLTVREARAAGLPVLVSDRGALAEGLTQGDHLTVLPAGDARAWGTALARLRPMACEVDAAVSSAADFAGAHLEVYGRVLAP
jgi:glycosyltransferase involved in cell wall biosynthesis